MIQLHRNMIHLIYRFIQIGGIITNTWPNDPKKRKLTFILREINWGFAFLNIVVIEMLLLFAVYKYSDNATMIMKVLSQFCVGMEAILNLILSKLKRSHLQKLLKEIEDFFRTSNDNERIVLQKYMDRFFCFFVFIAISNWTGIITFSCSPIFLSTKYPIELWYPFSTESSIVICILYATHVYGIMITGCHYIVNFIFVMLLFYSSARLEILCLEIRNAENEKQINSCIEKHQKIIKFFNETKHTIQAILFKTNMVMGSAILFGVFPIIRKQSLWVVSQFIFMALSGSSRLSLIAWTADDLKENSEQVAMEIYNIPWFEKSRYNTKDICFMIQRSQIPLEISIRGLMPALSLEYFTKFTATMLSYFTAMKAIIDD